MTRRTFGPIRIQMRVCQGMTRSVTDRWTSRLTFTCQKGRDGPVVSVRVDNRSFARSRRRVRTFSRSRRSTSFPPRADTYAPFESAFTVRFKVWKILRKQARVFSFFFLLVSGRGRRNDGTGKLPISRPREICTGNRSTDQLTWYVESGRADENPATSADSFALVACGEGGGRGATRSRELFPCRLARKSAVKFWQDGLVYDNRESIGWPAAGSHYAG